MSRERIEKGGRGIIKQIYASAQVEILQRKEILVDSAHVQMRINIVLLVMCSPHGHSSILGTMS